MDMSSLAPDVAIASTVQLAAAGDEVAFARIVAAHRADMVRVSYVVCGDWDLAQDAAQAALWIAWRKLPSLRDPARLRPWLMAVAVNEARAIVRHQRRHPVVDATTSGMICGPLADVIVYDEAAKRTVVSCGTRAVYDATADRWEFMTDIPGSFPSSMAFDVANGRLVGIGEIQDGVFAFDLATREQIILLEPVRGQATP